jgi:CheY-like chemotaxis protein
MFNFAKDRHLPTVLLIDDDMVSREVMATVLTMGGYTVHTAVDGADSLTQLDAAACAPELILLDAQMPGLSGAPLIDQLRARTQAAVIAISASAAPEEVLAAADGFLLKPFGVEELNQLVAKQNPPGGQESAKPATDDPVVSPATLAQLRGLMPDKAVKEIYTAVVADLITKLAALDTAFAQGDAATVRSIGHAIKGGCGMAGAMQAARLGALLEEFAASGSDQLDNRARLLADLRAATRNLESMLVAEFPA